MQAKNTLLIPSLEIRQGRGRLLYSFAIDGKSVGSFAAISRIRRSNEAKVVGYQRPEVVSHINEIRSYLESESPIIPNAIVLAFDKRVIFRPLAGFDTLEGEPRFGHLVIPNDIGPDCEKPAWIVDGQQRIAAVAQAKIKEFILAAVGFIAGSDSEQREQFILVNSTKPLPKGLIHELIPYTSTRLPSRLERRKFPAYLLQQLNQDVASPFSGLIQTPTSPEGIVKDNSILRMLENSLADGALYRFRETQQTDFKGNQMLLLLFNFWSAVRDVFDDAWGLPPRHSRLMHGAGIASLGFLMDASADRQRDKLIPSVDDFRKDLEPIREDCRWTSGYWNFGPGSQIRWNDLQNTSKDVQLLTNYLLHQYKTRVWSLD